MNTQANPSLPEMTSTALTALFPMIVDILPFNLDGTYAIEFGDGSIDGKNSKKFLQLRFNADNGFNQTIRAPLRSR